MAPSCCWILDKPHFSRINMDFDKTTLHENIFSQEGFAFPSSVTLQCCQMSLRAGVCSHSTDEQNDNEENISSEALLWKYIALMLKRLSLRELKTIRNQINWEKEFNQKNVNAKWELLGNIWRVAPKPQSHNWERSNIGYSKKAKNIPLAWEGSEDNCVQEEHL